MNTKIAKEQSGQALVEFSIALVILCVFVFGIIDFGRAIYAVQVMKNLAGEGSSMASRGTDLQKTADTVVTYAGSDIGLSSQGCVIVTAVTNVAGKSSPQVTAQASQCAITASSKIGCLPGQGSCGSSADATLPPQATLALQSQPAGSSLYVTEIYYNFTGVTPVQALLGSNVLPSQWYTAAYY
jgi:Flp pilus assembly protein TadG